MTGLRAETSTFLRARFPGFDVGPLSGDASTRRFFRLAKSGASFVLMDYGAPFEGETDDVRLSRVFLEAGLPIARIVSVAPEAGCLVLEDLGDRTLQTALEGAEEPRGRDLYGRAIQLAASVVLRGTPALRASDRADGPCLDADRFRFEMDFFLEHYVGGMLHLALPPAELREELHRLATLAAGGDRVFCHRDYHSRNLMVRADDSLAMVDIQDARWGPDTYDLASLLHDAYVDISGPLVDDLVELHRDAVGNAESRHAFRHRLDLVAAERMIKALGTFGFQTVVRRNRHYLPAIPRTLGRLETLLPRLPETARLDAVLRGLGFFSGSAA